ncbi:hypothetical protein EVAR_90172_1 [Eumeta japonica]|uniref:Uncharacterized protein n=1 Tax=Eumeta variegata TaxID=151549 RepID=A0A4C1WUZ8_EUMVA|nr:hypothetical protein EVAR_90172_1 [Eumeta japonica]
MTLHHRTAIDFELVREAGALTSTKIATGTDTKIESAIEAGSSINIKNSAVVGTDTGIVIDRYKDIRIRSMSTGTKPLAYLNRKKKRSWLKSNSYPAKRTLNR